MKSRRYTSYKKRNGLKRRKTISVSRLNKTYSVERMKNSKTSKISKTSKNNSNKSMMVTFFFEMLNTVKLYHWKTKSYAQHKATDELYQNLNENIDRFVEVWLGKEQTRIQMIEKKLDILDYSKVDDFKVRIHKYRDMLTSMNNIFDEKIDSDLLSIRDDILVNINQFLYLMSFH